MSVKRMLPWRAWMFALLVQFVLPVSAEIIDPNKHYTYLYFENGYPTRMLGRRSQDQAHTAARANPDLVVQTGYYSLKLDCDDMRLTGYDALAGSDYITALNEDVTVFSPAILSLTMTKDGRPYTCTRARLQDKTHQYVRLIESGQFVQRFDHLGLIFKGRGRSVPEVNGRLEVTAWPDRLVFKLDLTGVPGVTQTSIELTSPSGKLHQSVAASDQARLVLKPHLDQTVGPLNASSHVREAADLRTGEALELRFDEDEFALHIDVPADRVSYPKDANRVDEYVIEVHNPDDVSCNMPLVFDQVQPRAITGTVMSLCEDADGRPTGIPVQISKNWHRDKEHPTVHEGSWLRGSTMIPLEAGQTRRLRLRVIYGYWDGAGAVSHAQLCVIGYGGNWKWDESALGAWGETMAYDPTLHLGAAFIDDVRPAFTTSMSGKTHGWTENVGGGDFLIYYDRSNTFRWAKRLKTAYRWTGPNMTEVLYSGVTDDEKIRFTYTTRSVRTNDYHRRFHVYQYRFLGDVIAPTRLVFHQMAADYYIGPTFTHYYRGDGTGLLSSYTSDPGGNAYKGKPIPFADQWLAIDDEQSSDGRTKGRRGIVSLSSTLDGSPLPLYLHPYGRSWGDPKMFFDMSSESVSRSYAAGDVVAGELEFILPPKTVDDYWGSDSEFKRRLTSYGDNAWQAVYDEYRHNTQLSVTTHHGTLLRHYPVEIQASLTSGDILADFVVKRGGIGHLPLILKGVPMGLALQAQRHMDGHWVAMESVDFGQNSDYQGYRNAKGSMDCVFNLDRPSFDLTDSWRIRIIKGALAQ
jgi:hypothetical protein